MSYQDKLRAFADYLDQHPLVAERMIGAYEYPSNYVYATDWDDFQTLIGDLGGFEKSGAGGSLTAQHYGRDEDNEALFYVGVSVSGVCEIKPKVDEEGKPVMRPKIKYVESDEMEQVTEYVCPEVWTN